jgi:hypothetical protein
MGYLNLPDVWEVFQLERKLSVDASIYFGFLFEGGLSPILLAVVLVSEEPAFIR